MRRPTVASAEGAQGGAVVRCFGVSLVLLATLTMLGAPDATAMSPAPRHPALVSAPVFDAPDLATVRSERVTVTCAPTDGQPRCELEARWVLTLQQPTVAAVVGFADATDVALSAERRAPDDTWLPLPLETSPIERSDHSAPFADGAKRRTRLSFSAAPGSEVRLRAVGAVHPSSWEEGFLPPVQYRHLALHRLDNDAVYVLSVVPTPAAQRGATYTLEVTVEPPARWPLAAQRAERVVLEAWDWHGLPVAPLTRASASGAARVAIPSDQLPTTARVVLRMVRPGSGFHLGGPVLGFGAGLEGKRYFRAHLGYEVAAPDWLLYSLSVESDFRDHLAFVPMVEAATPPLMIFLFSVGVGAAVRALPQADFGLRVQGGMQLAAFGFSVNYDLYPSGATDSAIMGLLSF